MTYSEQLERETEQTRAAFERTLEELRASITPGQMVDQLMEYARTGTTADLLRNLGRRTVENPLPLVVIGAGLAWLICANGRVRSGEGTGPSAGTIAEAARSAASRVGDTARSAGATMGEFAHRARSQFASDRSEPQLGQTEARRSGVVDFFSDHPVALVGIGLAIGAAIGAAVTPPTLGPRREEEEVKSRVGQMGETMHAGSRHHDEDAAKERMGHMGEATASGTRARSGDGSGGNGARPEGTTAL